MDHFIINGSKRLEGTVNISGAKNSALKLMCAALLTNQKVTLHNIPELADITSMAALIAHLGVKMSSHTNNTITLEASKLTSFDAPYDFALLTLYYVAFLMLSTMSIYRDRMHISR